MKRRKLDEEKEEGTSSSLSSSTFLSYPSSPHSRMDENLLNYPRSPVSKIHENLTKDTDQYLSYPMSPMTAGNDSGPSHQIDLPEVLFQSLPSNYPLSPSLQNSPKYLNHLTNSLDYLSDPKYTTHDNTVFFSDSNPPEPDTLHYTELPQDRNESGEWEDLEGEEVELGDKEEGMDYDGPNSPPLYRGATISLHESLVSILTLALKFSLSGQLLQSLLKLIDIHLAKEDNKFKASLYLFKKYFSNIKGASEYTYYCSLCYTKCDRNGSCTSCKKRTPQFCLITLPLVDQIKALMARPGFYSKLIPVASRFNSAGNISDIHDGKIYKEHLDKGLVNDVPHITGKCLVSFNLVIFNFNIFLPLNYFILPHSREWYADGAEAYKSAKVSVWNLFFSINELPYSERFKKENLLVPAFFLLKKSIAVLQTLAIGVPMYVADLNQTKHVKFVVVGGTGDTPARALLLNMVAHNGEYPCQFCLQKGKCREDCPGVRVMPYNEEEMIPRTKENVKRHSELAKKMKPTITSYKGFHGTTPLTKFTLNTVRATSIDSMHLVYGGLGKLNLAFFVDPSSSYTSLECHVSKLDRAIINERLLQIKPPHFITRVPKSIHEIGSWQTSVHKSMFLYYGLPVMKGIIKDSFLTHYATLVAATQYLNADTITPEQMIKASQLIRKYAS
ncbi:hypothetical protein FOCC_FOCC015155 [Frankliniella occidentalis]|nr:hypothetical protein FOCC_FOCC015155 [Frankliniella occidentalis]